jgi:hypothetical protein
MRKANNRHKKWQNQRKSKKSSKTPPETKLSPLDSHYHVSSLNHPISKEFNQLCAHNSPPLAMNSSNTNREKNEMLYMRFKIRALHKVYKQVFKQLYTSLFQGMQNKSESTTSK